MSSKRELIDTNTDKRSVRRNGKRGQLEKSADVGRSLAADQRLRATTEWQPRQRGRSDRERS